MFERVTVVLRPISLNLRLLKELLCDDDDGDDDDTSVMGKFGGNGNGRRVEERRQEAEEKANLLDETRASYHEARGFHPRYRFFFFVKKKAQRCVIFRSTPWVGDAIRR